MDGNAADRARRLARLAGLFYLLLIIVGIPAMGIFPRLVVAGDAAATARNLLDNPGIVRLAFAGYLLSLAGYLTVMGLLYSLLRPVNREVALIALLFSLIGCAMGAASMLFVNGPLLVLGGTHPRRPWACKGQGTLLCFSWNSSSLPSTSAWSSSACSAS